MSPVWRSIRVVAGAAALAIVAGRTPAARQVFRSAVDVVELNVTVVSGNKPVSGLTTQDFTVTDNGAPQKVQGVDYESMPIDVTLVIDASGSITGNLVDAIVNAVNRIRDRLRREDRVSLVTFSHVIHERIALAPTSVVKSISIGFTGGWTSLNDAIAVGLATPPTTGRRQMAIVFTDGRDTMSFLDEAAVLDVAGRSRTTVFVVAKAADRTAVPAAFFDKLAEVTGGGVELISAAVAQAQAARAGDARAMPSATNELLDDSFIRAFDDFRASYVLRYTLAGVPRPGWHDVSVTVTKPGKQYEARTRTGYQR